MSHQVICTFCHHLSRWTKKSKFIPFDYTEAAGGKQVGEPEYYVPIMGRPWMATMKRSGYREA
jgi:hypothetical protein